MKGRDGDGGEAGGELRPDAARGLDSVGKRTLTETVFAGSPSTGPGKHTRIGALQRRAERGVVAGAGAPPVAGGGTPLPADLRALMELLLGSDLTAVRVHQTPHAQAIGARAFTRGDDLYFAPGAYDPESPQGRELIGHELTHVVQQRQGRVPITSQVGGAPANDDPGLEQEADQMGAQAARAEHPAEPRTAPVAAPEHAQHARPAQMKMEAGADHGAAPAGPHVEEPAAIEAGAGASPELASGSPIQRHPGPKKRQFIPFKIIVNREMTGDEFKAAANAQVFGGAQVRAEWKHVKDAYGPADSPVEISVEVSLLRLVRGAINAQSGIETDATGKVAGADTRAKDFLARPDTDEKSALLAEIDRRYHARSGTASGTKIQSGEAGNRELWNSIRDEVLFQDQYLANLPDKVKAVLRAGIKGRTLTPADYDQLFRIAKKIEALPPGMAADYAGKITEITPDLASFEAAIDVYRAELVERGKEDGERATAQNKLLGLEEVYKLYKRYITARLGESIPQIAGAKRIAKAAGAQIDTADDLEHQLEQQLPRHGFTSIAELGSYIARFLHSFEEGAVRITLDVLQRYAGKLSREQQRYQDPAVVKELHGKLGGFRAQHGVFETNARIWNDHAAQANHDHERGRIPGQTQIRRKPPTAEQAAAGEQAKAAKANAQAQIKGLSAEYPIFAEDELPVDKRLDKAKLAQADEATLGSLLLTHIAERQQGVIEARDQLQDRHALVYKMDKLMPVFYAGMDIQPGSIHDEIIKDKMRDDAISKIAGGILLAVVAVALTVVSLGAATPAVVAAGASIGAAGLSTYLAYEEYKDYTSQHAVAEAGLAEDPSTLWLVLAIVGAGVDMAVAVRAVRALAPAAHALEAPGGSLASFQKAVHELATAKQLEQKAAEAAERAASARAAYKSAKGELGQALGKAYSLPGPLTDPEVYRSLVKMAIAKIRQGGHSLSAFVAELRQARIEAKLAAELSPEELAKVKQAWGEAEALARSSETPVDLVDDAGKVFGRYQHGSQLEVISGKKLHGGNTIKLDEDATTTITGTLGDTDSIARRGIKLPGATVMGENPGGINILRSPKWGEIKDKHLPLLDTQGETAYWKAVTDEFWETVNKPWLDEAIARGDHFRFVSNPNDENALFVLANTKKKNSFVLDNGKKIQSIFGREVEYLKSKGYTLKPDGTAVKGV